MSTKPLSSSPAEEEKAVKTSQWRDVLYRLCQNKAAMVGLAIMALLVLCAIFADVLAPYGYDDQDLSRRFIEPCREFPFGTDNFGRDIFSRIIHGSRISLQVGLISVAISTVFGVALGAVAGYYGKVLDNIIMRVVDVMLAIPSILLAISIAAALGPGLRNVMIAISIGSIPSFARIVRASVLTIKEQEFVEAAQAVGAGDARILLKHILPNCMATIIVQATLGVAGAILSTSGLSFIGLGISPPTPEWGSMLSAGRQYIRDHGYIVLFPGLAIMITIFALNLLGDGLRDALDPRLKT